MAKPLWVKPSRLGSSVGISRVASPEAELDEAVELALRHDPRVIVEADAGGREVECSVIGNSGSARDDAIETSLPGAIVTKASSGTTSRRSTRRAGWSSSSPPRSATQGIARVRELAARVFRAIGGTGLARCDFFVRADGEVLVNEINTIPGFTSTSVFGKLFEASGRSYPDLCDRLVELAVERHERERDVPLLGPLSPPFPNLLAAPRCGSRSPRAPRRPARGRGDRRPRDRARARRPGASW